MESIENPTLYIVDGSAYIYRAYHAIRRLSNSRGMPTNALFGFMQMLRQLIDQENPELLAITFDRHDEEESKRTFRHKLYAEYKANRDKMPDDLAIQLPYFERLVQSLNIPVLIESEVEADDVIASVVTKARAMDMDVCIVSADKDLMQLIDDGVRMIDTMRNRTFTVDEVREKFGVDPELVPHVQALAGDSSDNVPGVRGIGLKTGGQLISQFGSLENLLANIDQVSGKKRRENLENEADLARLSLELVTLRRDLELELDPEALRLSAPDFDAFERLCTELEFHTQLRAMREWFSRRGWTPPSRVAVPGSADPNSPQLSLLDGFGGATEEVVDPAAITPGGTIPASAISPPGKNYELVTTAERLTEIIDLLHATERYALDLETTSVNALDADIVGVALSWEEDQGVYIPVAHSYEHVPEHLSREHVMEALRPLLEADDGKKIGQNVKYEWLVLRRYGIEYRGVLLDTMLVSYVLHPSRPSHSLDALSGDFLGYRTVSFTEIAGKGKKQLTFDQIDLNVATRYAAEDADITLKLAAVLEPLLDESGLRGLHDDMELPLAIVLGRMEWTGISMDPEGLAQMSVEFDAELAELQAAIDAFAIPDEEGNTSSINPNSPKQLREVLFDHLDLPVKKRTKSGPSTAQDVLEELASMHPLPELVLEYRKFSKLKSTYIDALPVLMRPDTQRIHTSFNQAITATGRLSSSNPNLQNIPIRTDRGRQIRAAFVPREGWTLLVADYSQIELRILAHMSGDPLMVKAYQEDRDIHALTAANIFDVSIDEVTADQRRVGKTINFGVIYGMGAQRLARSLKITTTEARSYIDGYFERYAGVSSFFDGVIERAMDTGVVETYYGRRRFIEGMDERGAQRAFAERVAKNTPIQGTAADIIKKAMLSLDAVIREKEYPMSMLLQVHDELVFEVAPELIDEAIALVRTHMEEVVSLDVPLKVDVGVGANWLVAK